MPRYFFPTWDGDRFHPDDEGLAFPALDEARAGALQSLGESARDILPGLRKNRLLRLEVQDDQRETKLAFSLRLEITRDA